jgi:hypothetical protein
MEGTLMALPKLQEAPSQEQHRQLEALLAALACAAPVGIQLEPQWDGCGWTLWMKNHDAVDSAAYDRFIDIGYELADRYGVAVTMPPIEAKYLDE